ncbi:MAG: Transcriptional regulator, family protein [Labilithrix sp.]|nr:Transcriptional regulator, family protein [Labilithrix sp.]
MPPRTPVTDASPPDSSQQDAPRYGAKVRALRRREALNQVQLAEKLGISPSYLNLIENNRRPLPANLLIKLAQLFNVDVNSFATDEDTRLVADLTEAFSDPLFEERDLTSVDVRELTAASPNAARAVLSLYRAYQAARSSRDDLTSRLSEGEENTGIDRSHLPSEEVSDLIQRHGNHFPALEDVAESLALRARASGDELFAGLVRHAEKRLGIQVQIGRWGSERGVLRRYDPHRKLLVLSELLPTRSRTFQLAHQIALVEHGALLDAVVQDPLLTTDESRALARVALGNYFAGAVQMPYGVFLQAAKEERYDIDVLGRRFRVGFEQVCHRLTTLRRPGAEGVPFHMIRIDVAGNISKRFSASGIRFARFSGVCPRWNVFSAFLTPGMIRIQVSRMPDGNMYFCLARTIQKDSGGYHAQHPVQAIGIGCQVPFAKELVYSDGIDLANPDTVTYIGVTCRQCERTDCEQRALPSLKVPLRVDPNVRGVSLYAPVSGAPPPGGMPPGLTRP